MISLEEYKSKLSAEGSVKWNSSYDVEQFWRFDVTGEAEAVWNYLADTSRFNREAGFAVRDRKEIAGEAEITTTMAGMQQIWIEKPWTWVYGKTINSMRVYKNGFAKTVHSVFHVVPVPNENYCHVYIYFGWQAKNLLYKTFLRLAGPLVRRQFKMTFKKVSDFLKAPQIKRIGNALKGKPVKLAENQKRRLSDLIVELKKISGRSAISEKLAEHILKSDTMELESIRTLQLAKLWSEPPKEVLTTCLFATRSGLLNISWNVVCPHCRGPRYSAETLGDFPTESDCGSCKISFNTSDPDVIEIVFKVNKSVREVPEAMYCAAEPAKKSHIKINQNIDPGQAFTFVASYKPGYYRARVATQPASHIYKLEAGGSPLTQEIREASRGSEAKSIPINSTLSFRNRSNETIVFSFEELQWNEYILRPSEVFLIPEFRDLFSEEHLNSAVKLHLGEQTILFTDIVGSTKFYEKVGDAKAFSEVRAHFQEIFAEVKKHNGAVVKTIGDAVMAAFPSLQDAFEAACAIQKTFHEGRKDLSIRVRISIHKGVVIAVQLNTGIDYFGSVVNAGAKIQSLAGAGEIALAARYCDELKDKMGAAFSNTETDSPQSESTFGFPIRVISIK